MKNKKHYLFDLKPFTDEDGSLIAIENSKDFPIKIVRVFYEYSVNGSCTRGKHANKKSRFCLIAVSGSCEVIVEDGIATTNYRLDSPQKCLFLDRMIWKTMTNFSKDCVLLVLSDQCYDKTEYIRDFQEYLKLIK